MDAIGQNVNIMMKRKKMQTDRFIKILFSDSYEALEMKVNKFLNEVKLNGDVLDVKFYPPTDTIASFVCIYYTETSD